MWTDIRKAGELCRSSNEPQVRGTRICRMRALLLLAASAAASSLRPSHAAGHLSPADGVREALEEQRFAAHPVRATPSLPAVLALGAPATSILGSPAI